MTIRDAMESDLAAIAEIYNEVLLNSQQQYPTLVAYEGESVIGFATFGDFRSWPGYRFTVEHTVHVSA